jgi:two-component system LytT family sensor kinase
VADYHRRVIFDSDSRPSALSSGARSVLALFIILFWLAQFGLLTAQRMAFMEEETTRLLLPRLLVALCSMTISFGIAAVMTRTRGAHLGRRVAILGALVVVATVLHAIINFTIFQMFIKMESSTYEIVMSYSMAFVSWLWSYSAVSGLTFALLSHFEGVEREHEISRLQRIASDAQLRALRYQLNPHFMFNTLNSVTALISTGHASDAEEMVENLADFLRAGLSLDALEDITLKRELELQSLYLAIEKVRFGDRLNAREEVSDQAARAVVPSLVTQPLIENAIRHGVAPTTEPVEIVISARVEEEMLYVSIRNTAPDIARPGQRGTGVGLINVEERLRARFGPEVQFSAGLAADGMYEVAFVVPCMLAGAEL